LPLFRLGFPKLKSANLNVTKAVHHMNELTRGIDLRSVTGTAQEPIQRGRFTGPHIDLIRANSVEESLLLYHGLGSQFACRRKGVTNPLVVQRTSNHEIASLQVAVAAGGKSQLLLGDVHYGYVPPVITGPHELVMLTGMGNDHMPVDTSNAEAQRWFDYALTLARAFEHSDAKLAFQKAARLDPSCSMCIWGEAYSLGPTMNFLVDRKQSAAALALALRAQRVAGARLSGEDRRLEAAMVDRYRHVDKSGNSDRVYARDLDHMLHDDPDNLEVAIFDAEAWLIMELHGDRSGLARVVTRLTPLVRANPNYTGLVHFYVHATEDAGEAQLAEPYAPVLAKFCPNASHLVHMPSHTYYRVGRYEDAAVANIAALRADIIYAEKTHFPVPRLRRHWFPALVPPFAGGQR
jgi:hypothetical protein